MSEIAELFRSDSYAHRVAARIRGIAAERGLMQKDLQQALGLTQPSQISRRMRGQVSFTVEELGILADLFEVEPAELLPPKRGSEERVRRQGLEPRTRWFGDNVGQPDAEPVAAQGDTHLAVVIPFRRDDVERIGRTADAPTPPRERHTRPFVPFRVDCVTA